MTIWMFAATEKYPARLDVNENLVEADTIGVKEMIAHVTPDSVDMCMILSASTTGVITKEKGFLPAGVKCNLSFRKDKKQVYDQDSKKYVEAPVSKNENYLFVVLKQYFENNPATGYTGVIKPWLNPYFWKLIDKNTEQSSIMAEEFKDGLFNLEPLTSNLAILTEDDKNKLTASFGSGNAYNKGAYTKAESEAEKLQARLAFLKAQTSCLFEWQTLGELALIIRADADSDIGLSTKLAIELTVKLMGNK
ncbi:MAG: hypothetical protein JGK32_30365 [Microcoleus sp. PH2017_31_RDM_U_A]|uniref:hypothetical protein n=2 Tax=Microcoleus TaxID=44471 RepID=UPI001DE74A3B|nr:MULTISPECIES: hypothetical protein [unclassified Microcoleus]MCC3569532.1 hypothetical protein [Microcoleus sp. PH2017_31_RDM_U_A]